ncbi:heme exporter protein CcmD [Salinisphaera sp. Q1T1-3]|uniref:heme exporter protein CcmD n=1 Tax=Salinisphaera sp. Q1T1-3 TaxID=2321229 RepID=UPI000E743CA1|nr:heme exporter protein CcmD [Salinisphaera sp. Q1T1-3]RJS92073.1 heme exporter protein CcmD [Salinisphaera sp. Q1T1-3]
MADSVQEFLAMGGYARYVWSAYGIAAVVLVFNVLRPLVAHRRLKRRIRNGEFVDD